MIKSAVFSKKTRDERLIFASALFGYFFGILIFTALSKMGAPIAYADMSSAFDTENPAGALIRSVSIELCYILIACILGFTFFSRTCACLLCAYRACLASFSSICILSGTYPLHVYFIHSVTSLALLFFLCLCGLLALRQSSLIRASDGTELSKSALDYLARILFFAGITVILVLCRHVITALIR